MIHELNILLNMREVEIRNTAIQRFGDITGINIKIIDNETNTQNKWLADAQLILYTGKQETRFWAEIKNEFRARDLPAMLARAGKNKEAWILICQYIPGPLKEVLRHEGINYLEAAGNCFIRQTGLYFYINDQPVTALRTPKEGKLWKQAGLKFLFGVLQKPEWLNLPYRQVAELTGVALGNIGPFIDEMKKEGYLKQGMKEGVNIWILENKEALLKKWVELFVVVLRPKLRTGLFRFLNNKEQDAWMNLPDQDLFWGGETGGARLTNYLVPEKYSIYTREDKMKLMKDLKLVPDPAGPVEMMEVFWNTDLDYKQGLVPPLLIYAELITSLDSRNRETAIRIKENYFDRVN